MTTNRKNGLSSHRIDQASGGRAVEHDRWVFGVLIEAGPTAMNLISSGACPRGREVAAPAILADRPLLPPHRRPRAA
jgi:hypothetical protein